jgi:PEP-CTERM motif
MIHRIFCAASLCAALGSLTLQAPVLALDFESFEFNDSAGTPLGSAANTANPGNLWVEGTGMAPSDVRNGVYNVVKGADGLVSNYLQIDNITSGSRYLVARMSGWDFYQNPGDPSEEFRLAFLNDDTGTSGATITAQVNIRREAGGENIVMVGSALGDGSASIAGAPVLNTTQTNPFTVVLELNKTSNNYKVFYQDGTNATQVLGLGALAPSREGNSLRLAVNNNFGNFSQDYPVDYFEVFSVDRIVLTDTNPFTDLITLEIDRDNAAMTLRNTSGAALTGIQSYSITSASGALNPAGWSPGAANPTVSTNEELAAAFGTPPNLANNASLPLSTGPGAWLKSPYEDLQMVLNLSGGASRTVNVNFIDNGGTKFLDGDFDFDNDIDAADWLSFIANAETDIDGFSQTRRYQLGDLNGDGINSTADFVLFEEFYDDANNGIGAFDAMVAGLNVPEPGSLVLFATAALAFTARRRRRDTTIGATAMTRLCNLLFIAAATLAAAAPPARAAVLEDFQFNADPDGTLLGDATNSINSGNNWIEEQANGGASQVVDGEYRIIKQNHSTYRNVLDIANVTSDTIWYVAELGGWSFNSTVGEHDFNAAELEQVNFSFIDLLDPESPTFTSSRVTAQASINRQSNGTIALQGTALGDGTNILQNANLMSTQSSPFTVVLELDKSDNEYSIYYRENGESFTSLGSASVDPARNADAVRFYVNNSIGGTDEFFDVNRLYLTDTSPIIGPVDPTSLTLEVKSNGQVAIRNTTNDPISFNSYRIGFADSETQDLNETGWNSLSLQGIDPVDGGDDPGETWTEAGGSSNKVLAESFLLGSSTILPDDFLTLGSAFQPGGAHELLTFEYHDVNTGSIIPGEIDFVVAEGIDGDYNDDGSVDAADYVTWRKNEGTNNQLPNDPHGVPIGNQQYNTWRENFGMPSGAGSNQNVAAPEPAAWLLVSIALSGLWARSRPTW